MTKFSLLLAGSLLAATPASAANLLTNGSFEDGFNGWTLGGVSDDGFPPVVIPYNSNAGYPGGAFGEAIPMMMPPAIRVSMRSATMQPISSLIWRTPKR